MGFGMLMKSNGFGIIWAVAMSVFIYAGSMQYAAVALLTGGASYLTVALTTLAVNARHIMYGISMTEKYKNIGHGKGYLIFTLTDETYSLVCTRQEEKGYYMSVSVLDHIYWILGTALGSVMGEILSFVNTKGLDFALTALFVTIFTEQIISSKDYLTGATGVAATAVCLVIFGRDGFLIPAMLLICVSVACEMIIRGKMNDK